MPRLTDTLCKTGGSRNPNVNVKKFMNYVKTYSNNTIRLPPTLRNKVSMSSRRGETETPCIDKLQQVFTCWKQTEFRDQLCIKEILNYNSCMDTVKAEINAKMHAAASEDLGEQSSDGNLNPKQANKLLRMYPEPPYKIVITHNYGRKLHQPYVYEQTQDDNSQQTLKTKC